MDSEQLHKSAIEAGYKTERHALNLELLVPSDIDKYIALERKVAGKTYSAMLKPEEVLAEMAKGPVYLIKNDDKIVGNASYYKKEDGSVYISGLVIDPAYQGQGFGRAALEQILEEIKGVKKIELVTHPDNIAAVSLYESLGFKTVERKEDYFGDGEPRIIMLLKRT